MKSISILGSTGSIGQSTLSVVDSLKDKFFVAALAAGRDLEALAKQVAQATARALFRSPMRPISQYLKQRLRAAGSTSFLRLRLARKAWLPSPVLTESIRWSRLPSGAVGFLPTYKALAMGRRVCLANKETLVMAGELMTKAASRVRRRPVACRQRAQRASSVHARRARPRGQAIDT